MTNTPLPGLRRMSSLGLGLALIGGLALAATPAHAAEPDQYSVSGIVSTQAGGAYSTVSNLTVTIDETHTTTTDDWGNFTINGLVDGTYELETSSGLSYDPLVKIYEPLQATVTVAGAHAVIAELTVVALPEIDVSAASVTITGTPTVGSTLTLTTTGWPSDATLRYQWGENGGGFGGPVDSTTTSYTVKSENINRFIAVNVYADIDGFATASIFAQTDVPASEVIQPSAAAPVPVPAPAPAGIGDAPVLAETGLDGLASTATGALMLMLGAALLVMRRRRQQA